MTFALFMGLLGEAIGLFGLTRRGWLSAGYYLALLVISLILVLGWASSGPFLLTAIPMVIFVILFVSLYIRQNEAREQAQKLASELESANRQLAEYAAQVEELTLATERQRLARELHDILSQGLAGLVLQLEAIKAHHEAGRDERTAEIINQSLARARSTLADSRSAIDDLRAIPASMPEAVRAKTERFTQATGIHCDLSLALGKLAIPRNSSDHILRVLNEALANVTRHAQANQVWVRLEVKSKNVELEVRDDGRGFDPEMLNGAGHYGLLGMRERARLVGGRLEIESDSANGTCIRLIVPLSPEGMTT
jgi:NarL family two-component system sensor histidine kinase YdfH